MATVQPRFEAYSRMTRICNGRVCWSWVDTRAYSPTRNIFVGACRWPKTLVDFAFSDARLAAIWRGPFRTPIRYCFRPCDPTIILLLAQRLAIVPGHPLRGPR